MSVNQVDWYDIQECIAPPARKPLTKFKLSPRYPHLRSDGMTHRTNKGTALQVLLIRKSAP